jgi:hypothetical protein
LVGLSSSAAWAAPVKRNVEIYVRISVKTDARASQPAARVRFGISDMCSFLV